MKIYQVDSFTNTLFGGNPAAVCVTKNWLSDDLMQKIANENNLSETAFVCKNGTQYDIRWFTPTMEVDLCGHATLAAAFVLFDCIKIPETIITFYSPRSGTLGVKKQDNGFMQMNFPTDTLKKTIDYKKEIFTKALGVAATEIYQGKTDYLLVFDTQESIQNMQPNFNLITKIDARALIVTAKGSGEIDFVSRVFAPRYGINEDPVTGSAHTTLIPYWAEVLKKEKLQAKQISARTGFLRCENLGDRVNIAGRAVLYMIGEMQING